MEHDLHRVPKRYLREEVDACLELISRLKLVEN
jgi:hypothetical protein